MTLFTGHFVGRADELGSLERILDELNRGCPAAIGGPAPSRVVRAWLIAQTVPQAGHAAGEFGRIELVDGNQKLRVL